MREILKLSSFARPIWIFVVPFFILSLLSSFFGVLNLALLVPVLQLLFGLDANDTETVQSEGSLFDIKNTFYRYLADINATYGPFQSLLFVSGAIIVCVMLANAFKYISRREEVKFNLRVQRNLRNHTFHKLMGMHYGYYSQNKKADIISRVTADLPVVQNIISKVVMVYISEPVTLIIYFYTLFAFSVKLTLFALIVIPVMSIAISLLVKQLRKHAATVQDSFAILLGHLDEALSGFRIIKAFNARKYIEGKYSKEVYRHSRLAKRMLYRQTMAGPVNEFLGVIMVLTMVLYGGYLVLGNNTQMQPEAFITYVVILSQAVRPLKTITGSFAEIRSGLASIDRILYILNEPEKITDKPNAQQLTHFNDAIVLHDVTFSYNEGQKVLKNINFSIKKGETVALVGPSGSGKTTISDLIPRFYDPDQGSITIDGINLRDCDSNSITALMGIVNQEPILFNDTIYNNIAFGLPDIAEEEVIKAAKIANAHDFILNLEKGYHTNIGDRGSKLSGGQRQRISIARAVLRNPQILILDEATSSLDTESEKLVQDAIQNLMKNRTALIIAHRLSTIKGADKIIVLKDGMIAETGTHKELINKDSGLYKRLKSLQELN